MLNALAHTRPDPGRPVEWVQIGATAGSTVEVPSALLRKAPVRLSGSGIGSIEPSRLLAVIERVLAAAAAGDLAIDLVEHPLSDVETTWNAPGRLVYRP